MRFYLTILLASLGFGCKPAPKISTYEVKSEGGEKIVEAVPAPKATPAPMQASPAMQAEAASFGSPQWAALPKPWTANAPNPMRKGSWTINGDEGTKAEITVTVFPGDVGGIAANVNRWRGQLGLTAANETEINTSAANASVGSDAGKKYSLVSGDQKRMTIALLVPKNNATWFCKISGDAMVVNAQTEAFLTFFKNSQLP
jgi:hypothetical protein